MTQDVWNECEGINHACSLETTAWRIEEEEKTATRKLVDSVEEQKILEDMIESIVLPAVKENLIYHPLIYKCFRNPPLKYGSRFGSKLERSLWYGSLELGTAMSEKAFYEFNFLRASAANFDKYDPVKKQLNAFSSQVKTESGINLTKKPFSKYSHIISSPISYAASQNLGTSMRKMNIKAFYYKSARDINDGTNIGVFTPMVFLHKKPNEKSFQSWQCIASKDLIEFIRLSSLNSETKSFSIQQFFVDEVLPFPAN